MEFDAVLIAPRPAASIANGWWRERTINDELDACVAECPERIALSAVRVEDGALTRFTYREMAAMAERISIGLSRLGVRRNDVVSLQLPNWWQFTLTYLACSRIVAVPAVSFAQSNGSVTRAHVRAELVQLENADYHVGDGDHTTYPAGIEAAEARVAAQNEVTGSYGGVAGGVSASGAPTAARSEATGNTKSIYFGH